MRLLWTMFAHYHGQVWDAVRFARSPGASEVRARRSLDMADLPEVVARRCRFIIEESQRVLDLAEALPCGEPGRLFELLSTSYLGARDLYEIGAPAMSDMMAAMLSAPGVIGARQAGAGFGGCLVALVREETVAGFTAHVEADYLRRTGIQPRVYAVSAAAGAGLVA